MHRAVSASLVFLFFLAVDAQACRCKEQNLAEYFDRADVVVIAKLRNATTDVDTTILEAELLAPAYKGNRKLAQGSLISVVTGTSSASCAVPPEQDAVYILFAIRDDGLLRVDSCNGSRIHLPSDGAPPRGFADVPPRFVASQLNALAGLDVMRDVAAHQPQRENPENQRLIGLVALPALSAGEQAAFYDRPANDADLLLLVDSYDDIDSREYDYEVPAAVVYSKLPGWYRIRLRDGRYAWAREEDSGTLLSYPAITVGRLAYLTEHWSGFVWPEIGAGIPSHDLRAGGDGRREIPVEVHEVRMLAGTPFLRVTVFENSFCGAEPPRERFRGWVPAFGRDGRETLWFWSRGC